MDSSVIVANLRTVYRYIQTKLAQLVPTRENVLLVAVSKTKPADMVRELYYLGQYRHFGENYVQELVDKSRQLQQEGLSELRWHFIGHLYSNKVRQVLQTKNLYMVETVDRIKIAQYLNKELEKMYRETATAAASSYSDADSWGSLAEGPASKLKVLVYVNTSGEDNKSGISPGKELYELVYYILDQCPHLHFAGLMTIGAIAHSQQSASGGENQDFEVLRRCRSEICANVKGLSAADEQRLELSMGMSSDFLPAIEYGSTIVRVGSTIFGERIYAKDQ